MSTKRIILVTISTFLILGIVSAAVLTFFFPKGSTTTKREESFDQDTIENVTTAKKPTDLTDFENLLRLQMELDNQASYRMEKNSDITANAGIFGKAVQSVHDIKEKIGNSINYQSIQIKEQGSGAAHIFAPGNAGTKVVFDLAEKKAVVQKAKTVVNNTTCVWDSVEQIYYQDAEIESQDYVRTYGNWGTYMTDYFFGAEDTIANPDGQTVQFDSASNTFTLKVEVNGSAAVHYINKIITLGGKNVTGASFDASKCATITFTFDINWKVSGYVIEEGYKTEGAVKTTTTATHTAKFYY